MSNYYHKSLSKIKNEIVLFTAAGFLGKSLELSGASKLIPNLLPSWLSQFPLGAIFVIMLIMVGVSLTGIHPIITGSALVSTINPQLLNLPPLIFGLTILSGWALSILLSPFSATNLISSGLAGTTSWDISFKLDGPYGISLLFILPLTLYLLMCTL